MLSNFSNPGFKRVEPVRKIESPLDRTSKFDGTKHLTPGLARIHDSNLLAEKMRHFAKVSSSKSLFR